MQHHRNYRNIKTVLLAVCLAALMGPVSAQRTESIPKQAPRMTKVNPANVSLDQKLDADIPEDAEFKDESGKTVHFGDYLGKKPIILNMIFYKCPGVCMAELEGMTKLFLSKEMSLKVGEDFEVVTISINPAETPDLAKSKKEEFLSLIQKPNADRGWHFLTGTQPNIDRIASTVGFRYAYDARNDQFAHPAGIILITPHGKVSRYFYSTAYSPRDVRLSLIAAADNKIGSLTDRIMLNCIYQYDPRTGKYGVGVMRALQVGGVLTLLTLITSITVMSRVYQRQIIRAEDLQKQKDAQVTA